MKNRKIIVAGVLCAALATTQTPCAQEPTLPADGAAQQEIFDVKKFVEQVEAGELSDDEIRADMNKKDCIRKGRRQICDRETPTTLAIQESNIKALQTLIRLGVDLNLVNSTEYTPLMVAIQEENPEALEMLIAGGADVNFQGKYTALTRAAYHRAPEAMQLLLDAKAQLDIPDSYGQTAVIVSTRLELSLKPKLVSMLLDAKADPCVVDRYGKTASMYAHENLRRYSGDQARWDKANAERAHKSTQEILEMLVKAGAKPEQEIALLQKQEDLERYMSNALAGLAHAANVRPKDDAKDEGEEDDGRPADASASTGEEWDWSCILL